VTPRAPARRITGVVAVSAALLALAACRPIAPPPAPPASTPAPTSPPATSPATTTTTAPPASTTTTTPPAPGCGASGSGQAASGAGAAASSGRSVVALVRRQGRLRVERHTAGSPDGARALARQLRGQSGVVAADVDQPVHLQTTGPDPYRYDQWALDRIPYEATWTATPGGDGTGVTVAVVDSGVNRAHEDLDDGRVLAGCDFSDPNGGDGGNDQNGHGTFVAGIVAAIPDNGVGISGAAPGVHILPVRVLDAQGNGWYSQIVDGITWATDNGANVINLSLAGTADLSILHDAVQYAVDHGVTVVMAAGNCRVGGTLLCGPADNPPMYPAAYADTIPGAIAVGATDENDAIAPFSNSGSYVKLAAPGVRIASTWGEGDTDYEESDGTSFAAPYVSAAVAILHDACPADTPAQLETRLQASAEDLGATGTDPDFGAGLVRPDLAVASC
jgi:subtilisin family serine protease